MNSKSIIALINTTRDSLNKRYTPFQRAFIEEVAKEDADNIIKYREDDTKLVYATKDGKVYVLTDDSAKVFIYPKPNELGGALHILLENLLEDGCYEEIADICNWINADEHERAKGFNYYAEFWYYGDISEYNLLDLSIE